MTTVVGQRSWLDEDPALPEGADFIVRSRTRHDQVYFMVHTPEGIAVHYLDGCEGEAFNGPLACWHSKEYSMNRSLTVPSPTTPVAIDFTQDQLNVIKNTIAKGASNDELQLFVATCRRTGLDPFLKQIYAIKRRQNFGSRDKPDYRDVMSIQVGIDGLRLIADRSDRYAGQDPIEFLDRDGAWSEVWTQEGNPLAARCSVYRKDWPNHKATAVCRWSSYAQSTPLWNTMPDVMLGKCAEALALRRAFPAEMSGLTASIDTDYDPEADASLQDTYVGAIEGELVQAPPRPTEPPPMKEAVAPVDLLNEIAKKLGPEAATKARGVMPMWWGTAQITLLSLDNRADYAKMLRYRLDHPEHAHELAYLPDGRAVCSLCGDEMKDAEKQEPLV